MLKGPLDTPLYRFLHLWVPAVLRFVFRIRVFGVENVPREGAVLLAANHRSNLDPIFIGAMAPRQVHFMAKSELWSFAPFGRFLELLGAFPVQRGHPDRPAVRRALDMLDRGAVVGMFPEGHRQKDGRLGEPQAGVGLFAGKEGVTTVPVAIAGTERIMRGGVPRLPRIEIRFGAPVDAQVAGVKKSVRHEVISRRIMQSLRRLLGQEDDA
ncbi:MAG: lysophospholipid acyltransferase family protein [Thermoleophilia bacterium]